MRKIHNKSRLVSMLASAKSHAPGVEERSHKVRHTIVERHCGKTVGEEQGSNLLECFGQAYDGNFISDKQVTLVPYMFSFAIENSRYDTYFTEKLIDCFITGTVPIYWGPKVNKIVSSSPHFSPLVAACCACDEDLPLSTPPLLPFLFCIPSASLPSCRLELRLLICIT
eukprot:747607-Hanusia_phi.AAC.5